MSVGFITWLVVHPDPLEFTVSVTPEDAGGDGEIALLIEGGTLPMESCGMKGRERYRAGGPVTGLVQLGHSGREWLLVPWASGDWNLSALERCRRI